MKETTAQQAGESAAEAAAARKAEGAEADGEPDATEGVDVEEPTTAQQVGEPEEAPAAEQPAAADERAVTERADEVAEDEATDVVEAEEDAIAADLEKARAEAESYLDDLRRLQADFDNYRKRTLREQTARTASASQALVARLLPVLDNFELAVSAAERSRDFDGMLKGVEMVLGALREVLEGEGLVKIEAEGKPFDPERHEAVIAVEQEDTEPGTVVDIVRTGYELGGKVLRPVMVKVAK